MFGKNKARPVTSAVTNSPQDTDDFDELDEDEEGDELEEDISQPKRVQPIKNTPKKVASQPIEEEPSTPELSNQDILDALQNLNGRVVDITNRIIMLEADNYRLRSKLREMLGGI